MILTPLIEWLLHAGHLYIYFTIVSPFDANNHLVGTIISTLEMRARGTLIVVNNNKRLRAFLKTVLNAKDIYHT